MRTQLLGIPGIDPQSADAILRARLQGHITELVHPRKLHIHAPEQAAEYVLLSGKRPVKQLSLFAMLRYWLWDIDIIINRALVYSLFTALLALVYFGLIVSLQALMSNMTSQKGENPFVLIISTLAIAALFQPLRHGIQNVIDRRFYRRKYDAVQVVEMFSTHLRNQGDLTELQQQLLSAVEQTMQPTHLSLWLRPLTRKRHSGKFD